MDEIRYTLLADGSSDRALTNIINWLFNDLIPYVPIQSQFADLTRLPESPQNDRMDLKILKAIEVYPCDILFVHRDSEKTDKETFDLRCKEIDENFEKAEINDIKLVKIIPVRMTETWLLIDTDAIKLASGNRYGKMNLRLPNNNQLENLAESKTTLHSLIKQASGRKGRRLDKLNVRQAVHLVAENISDFSPLRKLNAFKTFETELTKVLEGFNLNQN
jgi:hypothetical protein